MNWSLSILTIPATCSLSWHHKDVGYSRLKTRTDQLHSSSEPTHDKTNKMTVRPAKTQISLGIRPAWSESSLSAWRRFGSLATHWAHSKDSDQTWWHSHFVGFVMRQLIYVMFMLLSLQGSLTTVFFAHSIVLYEAWQTKYTWCIYLPFFVHLYESTGRAVALTMASALVLPSQCLSFCLSF